MKVKVIKVTPQEGESPVEAILRTLQQDLGEVEENPVNLAPDEEDNCQCNVCQLRRELESAMRVEKEEVEDMFPNPPVEEDSNKQPFLTDAISFSQALEAMRNGYRVARANTWACVHSIGITNENQDGLVPEHICQYYSPQETPMDYYYLSPFLLTSEDILATDWRVLKQS